MWLLAVGCGMIVGKTLIHGIIFSRFMRLKMFRADQVIDPNRTLDVGYFDFLLYFSLCLAGFLDGSVPDSHRFTVFILSRL